jgi:hypothetical protein
MSCKKYPEDEHYSLKRLKYRLAGTYVLDKYIVNKVDSTDLIPPCVVLNSIAYSQSDGRYYYFFDSKNKISGMDGAGLYNLINKKNEFSSSYSHVLAGKNILRQTASGVDCIWKIRKLDGNEFWLKQSFNGLEYELHLKKIHS